MTHQTFRRPALPALTGVRFFAACYVVLSHSLPWLKQHIHLPRPAEIFLTNGPLAVALFFLLSGFILAYTYECQIDGTRNRKLFWEARFARIYPIYLFSLVLAYWFERGLNIKTQVAVLTMVQAWDRRPGGITGAWNFPAWTLSVEAFFYLCFPFILPWMLGKTTVILRWIGVSILFVAVLCHTPVRGLNHEIGFIPLPIWRFPEFLVGVVLGICFLRGERSDRGPDNHSLRASMAVVAIVLLLSCPLGDWVSLALIPFAVLIYELAYGNNWLTTALSTRPMVLLGGASYSIYLLQFPVRSWMRTVFLHLPTTIQPFGAPLTPLVLILFSLAVFRYLEEPARRLLKRGFAAVDHW